MLPDQFARVDASLHVGQWRPALVVSLTLTASGEMRDPALQEAWVQVAHAWSYSAVERALAGEAVAGVDRPVLDALVAAGRRAEEARIRGGAWLLYRPDCEVSAPPFRPVTIRNIQQTSPGRRLVTEVMVQACAAVGQIAAQHQIALPFRAQARPLQPPLAPGLYEDPAACLSMFRVLEAGTMQVTPAPHGMMGVPAYVQFTSPLRRYGDILAHRQLVAWLRRQTPPHTPAEMAALAQAADEAAKTMRNWQRKGAYYFKLLWLAGRVQAAPLTGEVVRVLASGERLVFVPSLALDAAVRVPRAGVGETVLLRVASVHPSRGQLELQAVAG
jgi:exoribonuclease-2